MKHEHKNTRNTVRPLGKAHIFYFSPPCRTHPDCIYYLKFAKGPFLPDQTAMLFCTNVFQHATIDEESVEITSSACAREDFWCRNVLDPENESKKNKNQHNYKCVKK